MKTTKSSSKSTKVATDALNEAQKGDNPSDLKLHMSQLYENYQRALAVKRLWGMSTPEYDLLMKVVFAWYVEGRASTIFGLAEGKGWSLCTFIRRTIGTLVSKGLVYYYGPCGNIGNGKLWAPTSAALKIFGISETFTDVCA